VVFWTLVLIITDNNDNPPASDAAVGLGHKSNDNIFSSVTNKKPTTNNQQPLLIILDSLFTGGAEYSTLLWMEWLLAKGYDVRMVLLKPKNPSYKISDFKIDPSRVTMLQTIGVFARYKALKQILQEFKPAVVHSVLNASNFTTRALRIFQGGFKHVESVVNQPYSKERLGDQSLSKLKIRLLQAYDICTQKKGVQHFHANSQAVADHYIQAVKVPASKITVIPRGRTDNTYIHQKENLRRQYELEFNFPADHIWLINTGRHEYQKAHDVLLEALSLLQSKQPYVLLIAGREGKETSRIHQLIDQYNLKDRVRLLGHRTDIPQLLAASDLFVFPSRYEGMPGALIEACAAALPSICTDLPCMREVVDENSALFFPLNDAKVLSLQLDQMLAEALLRTQMGEEALKKFQYKFRLERIHERMLEVVI
jgi:glycosyltransferase involved in cell wall biosynthesis